MIKKLLLLFFAAMFLFGCASIRESEFSKHDTIFASGAHQAYSLWGYKNPSAEWQKLSDEQGWWGAEVPYIPAK